MSESPPAIFEMRDVTVSLSGRMLIERLNWRLLPGQVAVILGSSGSGKSVFLSTLLGFIVPDSGEVIRPGAASDPRLPNVAVLFQEDALLDDRTVEANLAMAKLGRIDIPGGRLPSDLSASIDRILRDVALDPDRVRTQLPAQLSGGMRRRVSLARALLCEPRVLLADEPTSGLDPQTAEAIYDLMRRVITSRGLSAVIITHDPICARMLANPGYEFTPLEGELQPWNPERMAATQSSAPGPTAENSQDVVDLPWPELFGRLVDRVGESVLSLSSLMAWPPSGLLWREFVQWGIRSAALVGLIFFIAGLVVQIQAERAVVDLGFSNRIPELFALAMTRTAPLLVGVLLAGRCGSTVSARTGYRVFSSQHRALETMGIDPGKTFMPAVFWSWVLASPLLIALGLAGSMTSSLLYLASPLSAARITPTFFLNDLPAYFSFATCLSMGARGVLMAGGASVIAYTCGSTPMRSTTAVMQGMTRGLVLSFIWLAVVDMIFGLLLPY